MDHTTASVDQLVNLHTAHGQLTARYLDLTTVADRECMPQGTCFVRDTPLPDELVFTLETFVAAVADYQTATGGTAPSPARMRPASASLT